MKQPFDALDIVADLTFKDLFKLTIARNVLLHYRDELESKRSTLLDYRAPNDKALFAALIINNPELSPKGVVQMFGLKKAF